MAGMWYKLLSSKNPGTRVRKYKDSQSDFPTLFFFIFLNFLQENQLLETFRLEWEMPVLQRDAKCS